VDADGLTLVEWVYGGEVKAATPCDAGRLAGRVMACLIGDWVAESSALFLASDGRYYHLAIDIGVFKERPAFAVARAEDEIACAEQRGDAARVEALKGHLAALRALAASEDEASADAGAAA
jgi:hypothetical protein